MKYEITVFTPTYNRKAHLQNIYDDLKHQTFKNFEWLIIDDGSQDGTGEIVGQWIEEREISINYVYKENGGKHTAINLGVSKAKGNLFFLADSDDRIMYEGLDILYKHWKEVQNKEAYCGVTGLFQFENGDIVGTDFSQTPDYVSFVDLYYKYNVKGDKVVCFLTEVMKEYPFPETDDIRFVMEAVVWDEMSKKYKVKCVNEVIQVKEYQEDGITKNNYEEKYIKGLAFSYLNIINNKTWPLNRYTKLWPWQYINLISHSLLVNDKYFNKLNRKIDKLMFLLFYIRGYVAFIRMKKHMIID